MKIKKLGTQFAIKRIVNFQIPTLALTITFLAFSGAWIQAADSNYNATASGNAADQALANSNPNSALQGGSTGSTVPAPEVSSVQSAARPFNLSVVGPVYAGGSDAASADFMKTQLPGMVQTINTNLREYKPLSNIASMALDPQKMVLSTASDVRVYFVGEGAGYHNTLGVNLTGTGIKTGTPSLVFPDASSKQSWLGGTPSSTTRTPNEPLLAGDFVNLGTLQAGQKLDFFLIADGANSANPSRVWTANAKANSDGLQHLVSFAVKDSPYLLFGYEDMTGGGDMDYNDAVFAVYIGAANVEALANPEPSTILTFLLLGAAIHFVRKRMNQQDALPTA